MAVQVMSLGVMMWPRACMVVGETVTVTRLLQRAAPAMMPEAVMTIVPTPVPVIVDVYGGTKVGLVTVAMIPPLKNPNK